MSMGNKGVLVQKVLLILFVAVATSLALMTVGCGGSSNSSSDDRSASKENAAQEQSASVSEKNSVDDYTWEELSRISSEVAEASDEVGAIEVAKKYNLCTPDGKLDGTQEKSVTLSDGTETAVQIAGFAHDDKTDGGKAGITFIFKDAIAEHDMNSSFTNVGGWEKSAMMSWLSSNVLGMLPKDLRNQIVAVDKLTNNVGKTTDVSSVTKTSDRLWLYSATELCGSIDWHSDSAYNDILNAEGSEYKLFRDSNVNSNGSNDILIKKFEGDSRHWWERSPNPRYSDSFVFVYADGNPNDFTGAGDALGVVPGFCI